MDDILCVQNIRQYVQDFIISLLLIINSIYIKSCKAMLYQQTMLKQCFIISINLNMSYVIIYTYIKHLVKMITTASQNTNQCYIFSQIAVYFSSFYRLGGITLAVVCIGDFRTSVNIEQWKLSARSDSTHRPDWKISHWLSERLACLGIKGAQLRAPLNPSIR